ncbi:hypothetical protein [Methanobrevibacter sp.]|uniref:hypothetical protein n=1 Tax=Methanobrevibacter sp. TaxID=66852 RepID=UPI0025F610A0|nr:hypothetical protein [Methanobrevibacter sp.]MBQ2832417.1 hypothetical protein [Methanobrevibacter sp.]
MSSSTNFLDVVTDSELQNKRATLRVLERRYDDYMSIFQKRLELPLPGQKFWVMSQVDLDDPRLKDIKEDFINLVDKLHSLQWEIHKDEAIINGSLDEYYATRKAYSFLDSQDDGGIAFLQEHNLTTHGLIYEILENPMFIEEHEHVQWLPVVRIEDAVFVKTVRGIEPVRKANLKCERVQVGDYAICKSIHNNLFMFSYCKEEVEV